MNGVVALLACHNRRELTRRATQALLAQQVPDGLRVVICDDGSNDGTAAALRALGPRVTVFQGSGGLFWCRGMLAAWRVGAGLQPRFLLWLNDDVELDADALPRLIAASDGASRIVVGALRDPHGERVTYGGVRRCSRWRPLRFLLLQASTQPIACDTFNGNCVLIPTAAAKRIGRLDPLFSHGMGDYDYGLRAAQTGITAVVAPGTIGTCRRNQATGTWLDPQAPLHLRWRSLLSRKGLPPWDWLRFAWRHGGPAGLLVWAWTYAKVVLPRRS